MKQSIISIGMTACCLSGNGQSLFAANKPAQEERPNILMIILPNRGVFTGACWGNMPATRISVAWLRRVAYWIIVFVRTRSLLRVARRS